MRLLAAFIIATAAALAAPASCLAGEATPLRAEGSEWVLKTDSGTLRSADLVGAQLRLAGGAVLRVDAARYTTDGAAQGWWAHELSVMSPEGWKPLCSTHSDSTHYAVVLPGREQPDGSLAEDPSRYAVSCTNGALAKCVRMGYAPWSAVPQSPRRGAALSMFNACVRMVRGDYGGAGQAFTENGQRIDVYDDLGLQKADMQATQAFEAGWDEHGAVCVHHMRVAGKLAPGELESRFPRLRGRVGAACTEAFARAHGALVFNRSADTSAR